MWSETVNSIDMLIIVVVEYSIELVLSNQGEEDNSGDIGRFLFKEVNFD